MAECSPYGAAYEETHVHSVYEQIASHFSSTRYKPWPIVERFLKCLPDGAVGVDVGCGNGKYLPVNRRVFVVGSDRSTNLVDIARKHQPHSTIVADNLNLPHPCARFDFAISIAVLHHLSTAERRIEGVKALLELLRPQPQAPPSQRGIEANREDGVGRALIYVWALEQKASRRGWDEGDDQDVMVPWVMKGQREKGEHAKSVRDETFLRYYHLYKAGELEQDIEQAGGKVIESGYEKDNWWAIAIRRT